VNCRLDISTIMAFGQLKRVGFKKKKKEGGNKLTRKASIVAYVQKQKRPNSSTFTKHWFYITSLGSFLTWACIFAKILGQRCISRNLIYSGISFNEMRWSEWLGLVTMPVLVNSYVSTDSPLEAVRSSSLLVSTSLEI
jgi:hypothetical protein